MLELAKADLAARDFAGAMLRAETVLRASAPPGVRGAALLLAGDAAYGMRAYTRAAERYREFLSKHELAPEAPRAALALGLAEFRLGRSDRARRTWARIARKFRYDELAPTALLLAAEAATQGRDTATARKLFERILERYPTSPRAAIARLSRSIVAVREGRDQEAVRDLRELVRADRICASQERRTLLDWLMDVSREEPRLEPSRAGCEGGHDNGTAHATPPGAGKPLERFSAPLLNGAGDPEATPLVLHGLVHLAAEDGLWGEVPPLSKTLVDEFPAHPGTRRLLTRVAARAASDHQWGIVRGAYERLAARYHLDPSSPRAEVDFAEALFRTGALTVARTRLARLMKADLGQEQAPRALFLLAQVNAALDRPHEALAAYERLRRSHPHAERTAESLLPHARLLQGLGRQRQARMLLEDVVTGAEGDVFGEAAARLGQILSSDGQHATAVKWYLTAAYVAGESTWGQRALLGALRCLVATGDHASAAAIYRRLLGSTATDPALLGQAREALQVMSEQSSRGR